MKSLIDFNLIISHNFIDRLAERQHETQKECRYCSVITIFCIMLNDASSPQTVMWAYFLSGTTLSQVI